MEGDAARVLVNTVDNEFDELLMIADSGCSDDDLFRNDMIHDEVLKELSIYVLHIILQT